MKQELVLIDGRCIDEASSGVANYCKALIKSYQDFYGYNYVYVLRRKKEINTGYKIFEYNHKTFSLINFLRIHKIIKRLNATIFHTPFHYGAFFKIKSCVYITTIHDLIYLILPNFFSNTKIINYIGKIYTSFFIRRTLKNSDIVFSVSKTTFKDILTKFGVQSFIVPTGFKMIKSSLNVSSDINNINSILKNYSLESGEFFLYVGLTITHKNIPFLINAYNASSTQKKLVIAGRNITNLKSDNHNILFLGYVPDNVLNALYKGCSAFIFPSLYEGFGIPILEALNRGCRVFSSNAGSLNEFSKSYINFFNPQNEWELKKLIENADNEPLPDEEQLEIYIKQFDQEICFRNLQHIISDYIKNN